MNYEIKEKLHDMQIDDFIWYIYIFIVFAALFSNQIEKEYIITNSPKKHEEYRSINIVVLTIAFFIYVYFVLKKNEKYKKKKEFSTLLGLISSILFLVAGGILLFLELTSSAIDEEGLI